jgi:hypothetical protein
MHRAYAKPSEQNLISERLDKQNKDLVRLSTPKKVKTYLLEVINEYRYTQEDNTEHILIVVTTIIDDFQQVITCYKMTAIIRVWSNPSCVHFISELSFAQAELSEQNWNCELCLIFPTNECKSTEMAARSC